MVKYCMEIIFNNEQIKICKTTPSSEAKLIVFNNRLKTLLNIEFKFYFNSL